MTGLGKLRRGIGATDGQRLWAGRIPFSTRTPDHSTRFHKEVRLGGYDQGMARACHAKLPHLFAPAPNFALTLVSRPSTNHADIAPSQFATVPSLTTSHASRQHRLSARRSGVVRGCDPRFLTTLTLRPTTTQPARGSASLCMCFRSTRSLYCRASEPTTFT